MIAIIILFNAFLLGWISHLLLEEKSPGCLINSIVSLFGSICGSIIYNFCVYFRFFYSLLKFLANSMRSKHLIFMFGGTGTFHLNMIEFPLRSITNYQNYFFYNNVDLATTINKLIKECMSTSITKDALADLTLQELLIRIIQTQTAKRFEGDTPIEINSSLSASIDFIKKNTKVKIG